MITFLLAKITKLWNNKISNIKYQISNIKYQISNIKYQIDLL